MARARERPVGGAVGALLRGRGKNRLHLLVADDPRRAGTGLIEQPLQPLGAKSGTPPPHRRPAHAQLLGHRGVGLPLGTGEHDACPRASPCAVLRRRAQACRHVRSLPDNVTVTAFRPRMRGMIVDAECFGTKLMTQDTSWNTPIS
jgi:hypothetical protein